MQTPTGSYQFSPPPRPNQTIFIHFIILFPKANGKLFLSAVSTIHQVTRNESRFYLTLVPTGSGIIYEFGVNLTLERTARRTCNLTFFSFELPGNNPGNRSRKLLLYISALFAFRYAVEKREFNVDRVREQLAALPSIVVDGLLSRFTEKARGSTRLVPPPSTLRTLNHPFTPSPISWLTILTCSDRVLFPFSHQATSATKTLLLTNLLALCLKLDNFATDTEILSHDLSMSKDQYALSPMTSTRAKAHIRVNQLFRSLGNLTFYKLVNTLIIIYVTIYRL